MVMCLSRHKRFKGDSMPRPIELGGPVYKWEGYSLPLYIYLNMWPQLLHMIFFSV